MENTQGHSETKKGRTGEGFQKAYQIFRFFLIASIHYSWVSLTCALFVLGTLNLYDIVASDNVPKVDTVYGDMKLANRCEDPELVKAIDKTRAWQAIQPALQILDSVCPQASEWARERHRSKKIHWIYRSEDSYAEYSHVSKSLMIDSTIFSFKNGEIACTIAHEFRHSRQNFSKPLKLSFSLLLTGRRNIAIIEDDAYLFEAQIREAIFGCHHGRR